MKITDIVLLEVTGEFPVHYDEYEETMSLPTDAYPEIMQDDSSGSSDPLPQTETFTDVYLEVRTDEGITGLFGPVDGGHAYILRSEMRELLIGQDPLAIEKIWDFLLRWNRHSHSGYFMMAMSALDCALWDIKGKALGQPVYRLLGGPVREEVPAYASMLSFSHEPEALARRSCEYRELGYQAQKWFFSYGPQDGEEGLAKNVQLVRVLREALGDAYPIMFDAFHSWDTPYSIAFGKRVAQYYPAWLEEPVPSDRIGALKRIRQETGVPIATGEHVYTRWQVKTLLEAEAVDYIQADPDWCGGISELVKIAHLCSAFDIPLCPHGHSLHASLHVAAALPQNIQPYVEFLIQYQRYKQRFMKGYLEPQGGKVRVPDVPGLGITLDPDKIKSQKEIFSL